MRTIFYLFRFAFSIFFFAVLLLFYFAALCTRYRCSGKWNESNCVHYRCWLLLWWRSLVCSLHLIFIFGLNRKFCILFSSISLGFVDFNDIDDFDDASEYEWRWRRNKNRIWLVLCSVGRMVIPCHLRVCFMLLSWTSSRYCQLAKKRKTEKHAWNDINISNHGKRRSYFQTVFRIVCIVQTYSHKNCCYVESRALYNYFVSVCITHWFWPFEFIRIPHRFTIRYIQTWITIHCYRICFDSKRKWVWIGCVFSLPFRSIDTAPVVWALCTFVSCHLDLFSRHFECHFYPCHSIVIDQMKLIKWRAKILLHN